MGGVADALHHSLESELRVGGVLDDALGAVRLVQRVHSLDVVAVRVLPGLLVVAGVVVLHSVLELVRNGSLPRGICAKINNQSKAAATSASLSLSIGGGGEKCALTFSSQNSSQSQLT